MIFFTVFRSISKLPSWERSLSHLLGSFKTRCGRWSYHEDMICIVLSSFYSKDVFSWLIKWFAPILNKNKCISKWWANCCGQTAQRNYHDKCQQGVFDLWSSNEPDCRALKLRDPSFITLHCSISEAHQSKVGIVRCTKGYWNRSTIFFKKCIDSSPHLFNFCLV